MQTLFSTNSIGWSVGMQDGGQMECCYAFVFGLVPERIALHDVSKLAHLMRIRLYPAHFDGV